MKRNHPPKSPQEEEKEKESISERLTQLFNDDDTNNLRKVYHIHRGDWIPEKNHTKLDSVSMSHAYNLMAQYSHELKYHFLTSFPTLFYLETYRLHLYYRNLPVSIAEAYSLLLKEPNDLRNYNLYQVLLRQGYVGMMRSKLPHYIGNKTSPTIREITDHSQDRDCNQPLQKVDIDEPLSVVLERLRHYGPSEPEESELELMMDEKSCDIFDVFSRKSFNSERPDKNPDKKPDKTLIITSMDDVEALKTRNVINSDLAFALVDSLQEFCLAKFVPVPMKELNRIQV